MKAKQKRNERLPEPRWTAEEAAIVKRKAKAQGLGISPYLRQAALCWKP